jgi:hypothetical protein
MVKNIKGTSSLAGKNVQNSESIGNLTADSIKTTTLVATNGTITNLTNTELQTATTNITALQTSKQDVITETTNIILNDLEVNGNVNFQIGVTDDARCKLERGNDNGNLKITANNLSFHDDLNGVEMFRIKNNGDLNCFDNAIDNVSDIDLNGSSLVTQLSAKQDTVTAGTGLSFTGATLNAEVTQAELDAKQDTVTAGTGLSFTGATLNAEVTQAELDAKQDVITDSTNIGLDELEVNDKIVFQRSGSTDAVTTINRSNTSGKMKFVGNVYAFRNSGDSQNNMVLNDSGTLTTTSLQASTFGSVSDTELNYLSGVTSAVQTQLNSKQATVTAGDGLSFTGATLNAEVTQFELDQKQAVLTAGNGIDIVSGLGTTISVDQTELTTKQDTLTSSSALSVASMNLNSGNLTNGGTGNFSAINLNGSDLQGKLDAKSNVFGVTLPLELDTNAVPNPALKLNFNTSQFQLTGSNLELNGEAANLGTAAVNFGSNSVTGVNSLTIKSMEINNSTNTNAHFLDFGTGDFKFRQTYNETANNMKFQIKDSNGANNQTKLQITYTTVEVRNSNLDLRGNDIVDVREVENAVKFVEFGGNKDSATNNLWGNDNYHDTFLEGVNVNATGMITESSGVFTINEAGTYTIDCNASIEDVAFNGRLVCAQYISVNDDTARFRVNPASFALTYIRDDNSGFGGSLAFSTTIVLAQNDNLRFKTKLGKNSDNRSYNDSEADSNLNWWFGVRFTKHLIA